ncbi:MAG: hypothetical protein ACYTFI_07780, partial [Planctomycetota bacterium]
MRFLGSAVAILLLSLHCLAQDEPRRGAVHQRAEREQREREPEWKQKLHRELDRRIDFTFVETPLSEAIRFLADKTGLSLV